MTSSEEQGVRTLIESAKGTPLPEVGYQGTLEQAYIDACAQLKAKEAEAAGLRHQNSGLMAQLRYGAAPVASGPRAVTLLTWGLIIGWTLRVLLR